MENRLANPAPLGLIAFALPTWLFSMVNSGWYNDRSMSIVLAMALVYGGAVLAIAGILAYFRGNTFATVAFLSYAGFYISLVSYLRVFGVPLTGAAATAPAAGVGAASALAAATPAALAPASFIGWYLAIWALFTFYMWVASFRHNMVLNVLFLAWWVSLILLAIGNWTGSTGVYEAGGYAGLVTAFVAAYLSAAEMVNGDWGRVLLPVWPSLTRPAETGTLAREDIFTEPRLVEPDVGRRVVEPEPGRRTGTRGL